MNARATLGLVVNPIAGMGGRVGLKGTDGPRAVERARALGATPLSAERAKIALAIAVERLAGRFGVVAAPGEMGEEVARACGLSPRIVGSIAPGATTAADTARAARAMADLGVDLLLFAGGDGTARVVCEAIGTGLPALGIPTGVKMHSAVYATTPRTAGEAAARYLSDATLPRRDAEVMDIDEAAFRAGRLSAQLYGYLAVPHVGRLVQNLKSGRGGGEEGELAGIAAEMAERLRDGAIWLVGPGTTTRAIFDRLGLEKTLLGVDVAYRGELVARDATERDLLHHLAVGPARVVVTPIGGQGYLFGRGNQQFSPAVIRRVGTSNVVVVATPSKLAALAGQPFLIDTGDAELDAELAGYVRVVTGCGTEAVYKVEG
jgi:predicted polyphosphate/ATP-dependent NAD kinase